MSSTNKTPNYNLPQFLGTDVPAWLGDVNPAYATIDEGMNANKNSAELAINNAASAMNAANTADAKADKAQTTADGAVSQIGQLSDALRYTGLTVTLNNNFLSGNIVFFQNKNTIAIKMELNTKAKEELNWVQTTGSNKFLEICSLAGNPFDAPTSTIPTGVWLGDFTSSVKTTNPNEVLITGLWWVAWFDGLITHVGFVWGEGSIDNIAANNRIAVWGSSTYNNSGTIIPIPDTLFMSV